MMDPRGTLHFCLVLLGSTCATLAATAQPQETVPSKSANAFQRTIQPLLERHCHSCHSKATSKPKGDFRVDTLDSNMDSNTHQSAWRSIAQRVRMGDMPPKSQTQLTDAEKANLLEWIQASLVVAEKKRAAEGRVVLRRLNRVEYENSLRDLLGIELDIRDMLPLDTSSHGFDNIAEALHTSSFLMDRYLEAADLALNVAIANVPPPKAVKKKYFFTNERQVKTTTEKVYRVGEESVVMFSSSPWNSVMLSQFYPNDRGKYRFRIHASAVQSQGKPVAFRVDAGPMLMGTKNHVIGFFDAYPEKPTVIEFVDHLEARSTIRVHPYGIGTAFTVKAAGWAEKYTGPGLEIHGIEVEGPLHEAWPPESHRRLMGNLAQIPAPIYNKRDRVEVASKNPRGDADRILRAFARRAFRRCVTDADLEPFLRLVESKLEAKYSFESAVRVGLKGILVSPDFLFLREPVGKATTLSDFALASRLSYFLWSSIPDEELLTVAEKGTLREPTEMRRQVERMLDDPKAKAFTENFVGQWLNLRDIDFTTPDRLLYPEYDDLLRLGMVQEAHRFFDEILKHDLSLTNFVSSDFSFLNARLAKHYGIEGIEGLEFRKVKLPANSHRGGVLTMASVLKVTANGTYTSPIIRGTWVLERILGTPPPKPPDGVPAVEPDIRGAKTIREQLAKHRSTPMCATCHVKIDPPGFALENFDVIGGYREHYRTLSKGTSVTVNGQRMPYLKGPAVDAGDELADGSKFRDIDEFKQLLLRDKDQLARALTERLATYATGAAIQPSDQAEVERIVASIRARNFGFRSLVHALAASRLFQSK